MFSFSPLGCRTRANCVRAALRFSHSTLMMCFSCRTTSKASYLAYRRDRDRGLPTFEGSYKRTMSPSERDVISPTQSVSTGKIPFQCEFILEDLFGTVNRLWECGLCLPGSGYVHLTGLCEHGDEHWSSWTAEIFVTSVFVCFIVSLTPLSGRVRWLAFVSTDCGGMCGTVRVFIVLFYTNKLKKAEHI